MRIAVAFDHRGVKLRDRILETVAALGHELVDLGTDAAEPRIDYPDKARQIGEAILAGEAERGVLVCGTGIGMAITANKVDGVRAALCSDLYTARASREHNDANVLALGGRLMGPEMALDILRMWLATDFAGGRHRRRVDKIADLERRHAARRQGKESHGQA